MVPSHGLEETLTRALGSARILVYTVSKEKKRAPFPGIVAANLYTAIGFEFSARAGVGEPTGVPRKRIIDVKHYHTKNVFLVALHGEGTTKLFRPVPENRRVRKVKLRSDFQPMVQYYTGNSNPNKKVLYFDTEFWGG